jgi:hypothetical protein
LNIDKTKLAWIVFNDPEAFTHSEAIVHYGLTCSQGVLGIRFLSLTPSNC